MLTLALLVLSGSPLVEVSGIAQRHHTTNPCMGGVRITEDMIEHQRAPLPKQPLTFIAGTSVWGTVSARTTTDAQAAFRVSLAPGAYCVVFGEPPVRPPPVDAGTSAVLASGTTNGLYDAQCLRELENPQPRCVSMIHVPDGGMKNAVIELASSNRCTQQWAHPCWRGPMPP